MRALLLGLLLVLGAWFALGALDVLPGPLALLRGDAGGAGSEASLTQAPEGAGSGGATLAGRAGAGRARAGAGAEAGPSTVPEVPAEVRGSAPRGALVRGRVLRDAVTRVPAPQTRVVLRRPNPVTAYLKVAPEGRWDALEARTDGEGRFVFRDVRPAKGYVVRAGEPGQGVASGARHDLAERQVLDLGDLVLGVTGGLEGRVLDAAGVGVVGARVAVTWQVESLLGMVLADPDTLPEREADLRTDATGAFRLEGLEPGPKTLVITAEGRGARVLAAQVAAGAVTRLADVSLAGAGVIAGRVLWDDGRPVPGARVFAGENSPGKPTLRTVLAADDGAFRFEHLDGASIRLGVFVQGVPVDPEGPFPVGATDVALTLRSVGSLRGRVTAAAGGAPVTRFGVRLEPAGPETWLARAVRGLIDAGVGAQGFQAEDGAFRLPAVSHGSWRLVVSAPGFPETRSAPVEVQAGAEADAGVIALAEGHRAAGQVLLRDGSPLAEARLHLERARDDGSVVEEDEVPFVFRDDPGRAPDAVTDAEGRFEVPPQTPARYVLRVRHPHAVDDELALDLRSSSLTALELRVERAGRVRARVWDAAGRAASDVTVWLVSESGWVSHAQVDDEGQAVLDSFPPGRALLAPFTRANAQLLRAAGYGSQEAERRVAFEALARQSPEALLDVRAGADLDRVLRLPPRCAVSVTFGAADEPPDVLVLLYAASSQFWHWFDASDRAQGPVRVEPGPYEVHVYRDGSRVGAPLAVEIPDLPAYTLEVPLPR